MSTVIEVQFGPLDHSPREHRLENAQKIADLKHLDDIVNVKQAALRRARAEWEDAVSARELRASEP